MNGARSTGGPINCRPRRLRRGKSEGLRGRSVEVERNTLALKRGKEEEVTGGVQEIKKKVNGKLGNE